MESGRKLSLRVVQPQGPDPLLFHLHIDQDGFCGLSHNITLGRVPGTWVTVSWGCCWNPGSDLGWGLAGDCPGFAGCWKDGAFWRLEAHVYIASPPLLSITYIAVSPTPFGGLKHIFLCSYTNMNKSDCRIGVNRSSLKHHNPPITITWVLIPSTCHLQSRHHSKTRSNQSLTVRSAIRYPEQFPDPACTPHAPRCVYIPDWTPNLVPLLSSKVSSVPGPHSPSFLQRQPTISIQLSS